MEIIYVEQNVKERLDVYLASCTNFTRSYIKQLISGGHILLNGKSVKSGKILTAGDEIVINEPIIELDILPQDIPLDILYKDNQIAVINKQQGLSVHPSGNITSDTLVNALMYHFKDLSKINGVIRPGIVHRLDKDTTGVMVIAKTDEAHHSLSRQIADRTVKKLYWALLEGVVKDDNGTIETYIGRHKTDRKKMAVVCSGRIATTHFRVLERFSENTLVEFDLITGRTHQIRVHSKHIGHPVVGDKKYGYKKQRYNLGGQLLHSYKLKFVHPTIDTEMEFIAPLSADFLKILQMLKNKEN